MIVGWGYFISSLPPRLSPLSFFFFFSQSLKGVKLLRRFSSLTQFAGLSLWRQAKCLDCGAMMAVPLLTHALKEERFLILKARFC